MFRLKPPPFLLQLFFVLNIIKMSPLPLKKGGISTRGMSVRNSGEGKITL